MRTSEGYRCLALHPQWNPYGSPLESGTGSVSISPWWISAIVLQELGAEPEQSSCSLLWHEGEHLYHPQRSPEVQQAGSLFPRWHSCVSVPKGPAVLCTLLMCRRPKVWGEDVRKAKPHCFGLPARNLLETSRAEEFLPFLWLILPEKLRNNLTKSVEDLNIDWGNGRERFPRCRTIKAHLLFFFFRLIFIETHCSSSRRLNNLPELTQNESLTSCSGAFEKKNKNLNGVA